MLRRKLMSSAVLRLFLLYVVVSSGSAYARWGEHCAHLLELGGLDSSYLPQLLAIAERSAVVGDAFYVGFAMEPRRPMLRARSIAGVLKRTSTSAGSYEFVAVDPQGGAHHRGRPYPSIVVSELDDLNTLHASMAPDPLAPGAPPIRAAILGLHGLTMSYSHMGSWYYLMELLQQLAGTQPASQFATALRQKARAQGLPHVFAMETVDLMGHGAGPSLNDFPTLASVVDYVASIVREYRRRLDTSGFAHVPLLLLSRSGSPLIVAELIKKYPGLIDGTVGVSPTPPKVGFAESFAGVLAELAEDAKTAQLNMTALHWFLKIHGETTFDEDASPFGDVPNLITTGKRDFQMPNVAREWLVEAVRKSGNSTYREYAHAAHDTYRIPAPRVPVPVYGTMRQPKVVAGTHTSGTVQVFQGVRYPPTAEWAGALEAYGDLLRFFDSIPRRRQK